MRDWGEESALFLASSLRPPPLGGPAATGEGYYGRQDGATTIPGNLRALVAFPARIKSLAPPLERWGFLSKSSRAPLSFSTAALHAGTGA